MEEALSHVERRRSRGDIDPALLSLGCVGTGGAAGGEVERAAERQISGSGDGRGGSGQGGECDVGEAGLGRLVPVPLQAVQVRCATVVLAHRSERGARTVLARAADQDGRQESACTARAARRRERPGEGVNSGACVS